VVLSATKSIAILEYLFLTLITIAASVLPLYMDFYDPSVRLLFLIHAFYLVFLYIYLIQYIVVSHGSKTVFFENTRYNIVRSYLLKHILLILTVLNTYIVLIIINTWSVLRGDFRIEFFQFMNGMPSLLVPALIHLLTMNVIYTSVIVLSLLLLKSSSYSILTVLLLEIFGIASFNPYISPIIAYPRILLGPIILSIVLFLLDIVVIYWGRTLWSLKK
jgi:hypothetical protein